MWWYMHDGSVGWGWMVFGAIWMVVFWGAILALGLWIIRRLTDSQGRYNGSDPLEILKGRYARGEISKQQFEEIKRDLR